jgi:succinate dehydrogenase flavin-adding protein (antitoxin of CptAB toxin-antitoxin module)
MTTVENYLKELNTSFDQEYMTIIDVKDDKLFGFAHNPVKNSLIYIVVKNNKTRNFSNFRQAQLYYG